MARVRCKIATVYAAFAAHGIRGKKRVRRLQPRKPGIGRNEPYDVLRRPARMPAVLHPSITEGRTRYPSKVQLPGKFAVLKRGVNGRKTGPRIAKGAWKGLQIYSLTLEERATCPTSCERWRSCFGNNTHWPTRHAAGPELEARLEIEVSALARKHPNGYGLRLHILGDFYSVAYVELWRTLIERHPELHIFGFTRRWDSDDPIARAVLELMAQQPERFKMRLSNSPTGPATITVETPLQVPADAILCPEHMEKTATCGTCGLCWTSTRRIALLQH